jgi:hypothetical protein
MTLTQIISTFGAFLISLVVGLYSIAKATPAEHARVVGWLSIGWVWFLNTGAPFCFMGGAGYLIGDFLFGVRPISRGDIFLLIINMWNFGFFAKVFTERIATWAALRNRRAEKNPINAITVRQMGGVTEVVPGLPATTDRN